MILNKTRIQYKLNSTKLAKSVKWTPKISLEKGLKMMIKKKYY
jgi:dTDP-D-glucose 4,6-dehydratase